MILVHIDVYFPGVLCPGANENTFIPQVGNLLMQRPLLKKELEQHGWLDRSAGSSANLRPVIKSVF
jgi:hypothetical protein